MADVAGSTPTVARAFVLGGQGAGKSTLVRLCSAKRPAGGRLQLGSTLLVDPLNGTWEIELAFVEVPASWTLEDFRRSSTAGPVDCALLVVDAARGETYAAARERAGWARAVGIRCAFLLTVGSDDAGAEGDAEAEAIAERLSVVQPAHFDLRAGPCQALHLGLFLDVLAVRLAWICWEEGVATTGPARGVPVDAREAAACFDGSAAEGEARCGEPRPRRSSEPRAPGPPRCAHVVPARYATAARARTPEAAQRGRSATPRRAAADDLPAESLRGRVGAASPRGTAEVRAPPAKAPLRGAGCGVRETVVSLAALQAGTAQAAEVAATRSADSFGAGPVPQFEVELDIGDGRIAPIVVHEGTDLDSAAAAVAGAHILGGADERRIAAYLRRMREEVLASAAAAPGRVDSAA